MADSSVVLSAARYTYIMIWLENGASEAIKSIIRKILIIPWYLHILK
jgi:hypothetical protein